MKRDSKSSRGGHGAGDEQRVADGDRLRPLWLGTLSSLCVATPVLPTETVLLGGSVFLLMLVWWVLLGAWGLTAAAAGRVEVRLGPATWAFAGLLAWHSTSGLVMGWAGNPRATSNMTWLWISFGIAFFLTRQLVITAVERRAVLAVMIASAVCLSAVAYYQYFYEFPATLRQYQHDPEQALREAGIFAPPGSSPRRHFEDRLRSTEPIATFALTNSLAAFLSPWLIVTGGILLTNWHSAGRSRAVRVAGITAILLLLGCLILTKSRTAWLALIVGIALLVAYGRRAGWRPDWRLLVGIAGAVILLPALAAWIGGLDWLVVLESSKSFLYRIQYWHSTAAMIRDYPLFGCGPGNFQQYYTAYKLPEASETIAEPHNFLMEVWSTAGTPAAMLLLAVLAGVAWGFRRRAPGQDQGSLESARLAATSGPQNILRTGSPWPVYLGAGVGLVAAVLACGRLEGYFPSPALLLIGAPLAIGTLVLLHHWVHAGALPPVVLAIALAVMIINLLAASGIGFAGVALSLWVLAALLLNQAAEEGWGTVVDYRPLGRREAILITIVVAGLLAWFYRTGYSPVTTAGSWIAEGNSRRLLGQPIPAWDAYRRAAAADPRSPEPWEQINDLASEAWLQTGQQSYLESFEDSVHELLARNKRSSTVHTVVGHRWLAAYRRFGQRAYLDAAIESYGIAVKLYPNYNLGHAQLAWVFHLAGDERAGKEVEEALRLDALVPHSELRLSQQQLFDVQPADADQLPPGNGGSAELVLLKLRKT